MLTLLKSKRSTLNSHAYQVTSFCIAHFLISQFYLWPYAYYLQFNKRVVQLHLLLMALCFILIGIGLVLLPMKFGKQQRVVTHGLAILLTLWLLILSLFYGLHFISNWLWGENLTSGIFLEYISQLHAVRNVLPVDDSIILLLVILFSMAIYLIFTRYLSFIQRLFVNKNTAQQSDETQDHLSEISYALQLILFFCSHLFIICLLFRWFRLTEALLILTSTTIFFYIVPLKAGLLPIYKSDFLTKIKQAFSFNKLRPTSQCFSLNLLLIGFCLYGPMALFLTIRTPSVVLMTKEPLLAFINNTQVVGATVTPHKLQVAEVDRAARITYPRSQLTAEAPTVVLIIIDALRPDHMGIYNYERATTPFLSKLAGAGKIETVDLAVSTCSNSYCGILSILASKPFRDITQPNFKVYDLLYDQGYNVYFIVSGTHNNWYNLRAAYGESIDLFFDGSQSTWGSNDDRLLFDGLQLVPPSSGDPAFFYFHLMSVHLGGVLQPEYERFGSSQIKLTSSFLQQNEEILVNRYDSAIVQADAYIEQIFHVLDSKGYLENSFIVITSDHGENLDTTKSIGHSWNLDQSQIRIPLVVYDSTGRKLNDSATGTHIDIAPTIVDRIGLPIPQVWQGQSLFHEAKERFTFHETQKAPAERAVIYWQQDHVYKMVLQSDKRLETAKVFDIAVDPEAKTDLATTIDRILLEKLKQAYRHHWVSAKE